MEPAKDAQHTKTSQADERTALSEEPRSTAAPRVGASPGVCLAGFAGQRSFLRARSPEELPLAARRGLTAVLTALLVAAACPLLWRCLWAGHLDAIDWVASGLFLIVMAAGALNFWFYVVGFLLLRRRKEGGRPAPDTGGAAITTRTALVMPVLNEECDRVEEGLRRIGASLARAGLAPHCEVYLLSDSTDEGIRAGEERLIGRLREESRAGQGLDAAPLAPGAWHLVRRPDRENFKAGNIAHFLEQHGWAYDFMLVLDADSVMLGQTIKRLIQRLQASPRTALLQNMMVPIRAVTPFARLMQFGILRCLPMYAAGCEWFYGPESVFWGHNALVRVAPFMRHCHLPRMPGRPPLGGTLLSHDIVEAALLGRAGWAVEWDITAGGSYDEIPANLLTYGKRDRRWCQGNFQHFWLIFGDGMKAAHRFYFALGIIAYSVAPMFLLLMGLGFVQGLRGRAYRLDAFAVGWFLTFYLGMLLVPRVLGLRHMLDQGQPFWREVRSSLVELGLNLLVAPSIFYLHVRFVLEVLSGRVVPWQNQSRNPAEGLGWGTAAGLLWPPTVLGLAWLVVARLQTPNFLLCLLPLLAGWIVSIPAAIWSSDPELGAWLARHHLLDDALSDPERTELGPLGRT